MLKDDTKDQIPLFDLPTPDKSSDTPPAGVSVTTGTHREEPVPEKKVITKKASPRLPAREIKSQAANRSTAKKGRAAKAAAGPVPEGDVRLTANIREDLHLKLKIVAATRRTTIGELLEELVEHYL